MCDVEWNFQNHHAKISVKKNGLNSTWDGHVLRYVILAVSGKARLQVAGLVSAADWRRAALAAAAALHAAYALPVRGASFSVKETMARRTLIIGLHRSISPKRLRIFCCIFRLKFRWRIWVSASSRSCDIVIVILLCVADHSTRGFWFFSCLQLRIWNLGIDQYGCCMSFGNNSIQEWFCSLDNYNISSEYIALSSAGKSWALLQIKRNRWAAGKYWWWVLVRGLGSEYLIHH